MNKLIIAMIACVLACTSIAGSANLLLPISNGMSVNNSTININSNDSYSNTTNLQVVYSAETYLVDRLGQSYYNKYISYSGAKSYGNTSYVYFAYNVPFFNGTTAMNSTDMEVSSKRPLGITVSLYATNVTGYIGPAQPYLVGISPSEAVDITQQYGFTNGTATIYGLFNSSGVTTNSTYLVAWAVLENTPLKSGLYRGIYVNAVSGKVLGEYTFYPNLNISLQDPGYAYGTFGNFTIFYMSDNQSQSKLSLNSNSPDSEYVLPLTALAFVILGIALYLSRKGA